MPDPKIENHAEDMERGLHRLEDRIEDAEKKAAALPDAGAQVAGDWEDEQDRGGGDDPEGAAEVSPSS